MRSGCGISRGKCEKGLSLPGVRKRETVWPVPSPTSHLSHFKLLGSIFRQPRSGDRRRLCTDCSIPFLPVTLHCCRYDNPRNANKPLRGLAPSLGSNISFFRNCGGAWRPFFLFAFRQNPPHLYALACRCVGNPAVLHANAARIVAEMAGDIAGATDGIDIPSLRRRVRARQLRIQVNRMCIELLSSVGDSVWGMTNRTGDPHVQDMAAMMLENRVFRPNRGAVAQQSRDVVTLLAHRESAGERIQGDGQRLHWLPGIRHLIQRVWPFEKVRITADVRTIRPVPTVIGRVLSAMAICALQEGIGRLQRTARSIVQHQDIVTKIRIELTAERQDHVVPSDLRIEIIADIECAHRAYGSVPISRVSCLLRLVETVPVALQANLVLYRGKRDARPGAGDPACPYERGAERSRRRLAVVQSGMGVMAVPAFGVSRRARYKRIFEGIVARNFNRVPVIIVLVVANPCTAPRVGRVRVRVTWIAGLLLRTTQQPDGATAVHGVTIPARPTPDRRIASNACPFAAAAYRMRAQRPPRQSRGR